MYFQQTDVPRKEYYVKPSCPNKSSEVSLLASDMILTLLAHGPRPPPHMTKNATEKQLLHQQQQSNMM